jgi:hypothetical protein
MKPYPFELLNHFTVPCTYMLLPDEDLDVSHSDLASDESSRHL